MRPLRDHFQFCNKSRTNLRLSRVELAKRVNLCDVESIRRMLEAINHLRDWKIAMKRNDGKYLNVVKVIFHDMTWMGGWMNESVRNQIPIYTHSLANDLKDLMAWFWFKLKTQEERESFELSRIKISTILERDQVTCQVHWRFQKLSIFWMYSDSSTHIQFYIIDQFDMI